jgi:hypothetical protein
MAAAHPQTAANAREAAAFDARPAGAVYSRGERLGKGSFGIVYGGTTIATPHKPVALKLVDAKWMRTEFLRKQTVEEVIVHRKATAIGHPALLGLVSACVGACAKRAACAAHRTCSRARYN